MNSAAKNGYTDDDGVYHKGNGAVFVYDDTLSEAVTKFTEDYYLDTDNKYSIEKHNNLSHPENNDIDTVTTYAESFGLTKEGASSLYSATFGVGSEYERWYDNEAVKFKGGAVSCGFTPIYDVDYPETTESGILENKGFNMVCGYFSH